MIFFRFYCNYFDIFASNKYKMINVNGAGRAGFMFQLL